MLKPHNSQSVVLMIPKKSCGPSGWSGGSGKGFEGPVRNTEVMRLTFGQRGDRCLYHLLRFAAAGCVASAVRLENSKKSKLQFSPISRCQSRKTNLMSGRLLAAFYSLMSGTQVVEMKCTLKLTMLFIYVIWM